MLLVFSVLFCCICVLGWDCRDYIPPSNKATFVKKRGDLPGFHIKKPAPCVLEEGLTLQLSATGIFFRFFFLAVHRIYRFLPQVVGSTARWGAI